MTHKIKAKFVAIATLGIDIRQEYVPSGFDWPVADRGGKMERA